MNLKLLNSISSLRCSETKGYRGPNLRNSTYGGFECEFSVPVANFNLEKVTSLCEEFCYVPLLEIDKMVLRIDRPGIIQIELKMLNELLKCVEEL